MRGLVLRVTPTGVKSWNVVYSRKSDGRKRRFTFGHFPTLDLAGARQRALLELGKIGEGSDPAAKRQDVLTVEQIGARYIERYAKVNKRTWQEDERMLIRDVYPVIGRMAASKVTKRDLLDLLDTKVADGAPIGANRLLAMIRKLFNWAEDEALISTSPAVRMKPRSRAVTRDRVLPDDKIIQFVERLPTAAIHPLMQHVLELLLLTGQRAGEICGLCKGEVDIVSRRLILDGTRTKNGQPHTVPVAGRAWEIVEGRLNALEHATSDAFLFARTGGAFTSNAVAQAVRKNGDHFGLSRWTPHDLRRSAATGMAELGVAPHVIEAILNHISGARAGVAGIYNRAAYANEKRSGLELWAAHVRRISSIPEDGFAAQNVVALSRVVARQ